MSEHEIAINIKKLRCTFDGRHEVLSGIDLEIPKGSITVIIGYSGTGKSVLLKHMIGLLKAMSGTIEVFGENLRSFRSRELAQFRTRFGVLFQSAALFDDMSALDNVMFPIREHRPKWSEDEVINAAKERLRSVGLEEKHDEKLPSALSGGMQKRVGLARALALDPEIIFYDEPTTGLDPILTEMVDNLIVDTHRRRSGITTVIISHDLAAAFRMGDYVAMLNQGRVLLFGTPEDFRQSNDELVRRFIGKGIR